MCYFDVENICKMCLMKTAIVIVLYLNKGVVQAETPRMRGFCSLEEI